jgi:hypothetical protein
MEFKNGLIKMEKLFNENLYMILLKKVYILIVVSVVQTASLADAVCVPI